MTASTRQIALVLLAVVLAVAMIFPLAGGSCRPFVRYEQQVMLVPQDARLENAFREGAAAEAIADLVDANPHLLAPEVDGETPLHLAAMYNRPELVAVFVERAVPIDGARHPDFALGGATALFLAVQAGHADVVAELLKHGADLDRGPGGRARLHELARRHPEIQRMLEQAEHR